MKLTKLEVSENCMSPAQKFRKSTHEPVFDDFVKKIPRKADINRGNSLSQINYS